MYIKIAGAQLIGVVDTTMHCAARGGVIALLLTAVRCSV